MKRQTFGFEVLMYETLEELPAEDKALMLAAMKAREQAYAPYSHFKVGAAVRMRGGETILGNNQENASYPSGLCAERVAVFQAGALYPDTPIHAIAVSAASLHHTVNRPAAPCGNCRQALAEYEMRHQQPIKLVLRGETGPIMVCHSIADILPLGFDSSYLG